MVSVPEIHVLDHKVRLYQAEGGFRTSMDSVFLAAACPAKGGGRVLDMGAGVGGATFCLSWRVPEASITAVEIQESHADLARRNAQLNDVEERVEIITGDILKYTDARLFDHAICNPPYLEAGSYTRAASDERAVALGHHEGGPMLEDWIKAGFRNIRSGGSLTMIHRADHVDRIIRAMGKKFGAAEIFPIYPYAGQDAKRVIIRAVNDRKTPARLRAGIVLHEKTGEYSQEADAILRSGAAIE